MAIQTRQLGNDALVSVEVDWDDVALTVNAVRCINTGPNTVSITVTRPAGQTITRSAPPGTRVFTLPTPIPIALARNKLDGATLTVDYGMA